jgi:hypothetical protein
MPQKAQINPGDRFERLTVVAEIKPKNFDRKGNGLRRFQLRCDCGTMIETDIHHFRRGDTRSCGCLHTEVRRKIMKKVSRHYIPPLVHGFTRVGQHHPLYRVWRTMKTRCYNDQHPTYKDYGARGIYICDEWRESAGGFITWALENEWKEKLFIDRIDNDGPYAPWNCRFVTPKESRANQRPRKTRLAQPDSTLNIPSS